MAGKPRINIDFEKIYESNSCGKFKIIKNLGRDDKSRLYVRIKFLDTNTEKDVRYDNVMSGKVIDDLYDIDFDKIYNSIYYGPFKIISYLGRNNESRKIVRIKFLNTGFEYDTLLKLVIAGQVKDHSIDYNNRKISQINYDNNIYVILKNIWSGMMSRCYNKNDSSYHKYGALGVSVCDLWKNFNSYIDTIQYVQNYYKFYYNPTNYHLDKDLLQQNIPKNKRIYSPETCIFLSLIDNSNLSIKENHKGYYGIKEINGKYKILFSINGKRHYFGLYSDLNAALNEYNYYYLKYSNFEYVPLLNEVFYTISHEEAQKYKISN